MKPFDRRIPRSALDTCNVCGLSIRTLSPMDYRLLADYRLVSVYGSVRT